MGGKVNGNKGKTKKRKKVDRGTLKRLAAFVRPYLKNVIFSLACAAVTSATALLI